MQILLTQSLHGQGLNLFDRNPTIEVDYSGTAADDVGTSTGNFMTYQYPYDYWPSETHNHYHTCNDSNKELLEVIKLLLEIIQKK